MKRLLNTLYVTTQGAYLSKEGETVLVNVEKETRLRLPIHNLGGIVCFGRVSLSPFLVGFCGERGVSISHLTENGRFLGRYQGPVSGNVLLRREQYRWADDMDQSARIAGAMVAAKIVNSRHALRRSARDGRDPEAKRIISEAADGMEAILGALKNERDLEAIRGREGEAAALYFRVFDHLIATGKDDFYFHERSRRPPLDNVNTLLSFLYTLLAHDAASALEGVGLDPAVGFLHRDRPGRPSLALDLMEEFRPVLADRLVLSLINRKQVKPGGFVKTESGGVRMNDDTRKEVLVAYQKRKQEEVIHPFLGETVSVGHLVHLQALLLARYIRGDIDGYPPFVWR